MFSKTVLLIVVYILSDFSQGQKVYTFFREDYIYIEAVDSFYKIHENGQTWPEAKQQCIQEGATLWYPDNEAELLAVKTFWKTTQPKINYVYVGLSNEAVEGEFKTIDGKPVSEVYNKWEKGQPNDYHGYQDCVYLTDYNEINDWGCDYEYAFICEKSLESLEPSNIPDSDGPAAVFFRNNYTYIDAVDSFYKIHTKGQTWPEAKQQCIQEGATLWYPENEAEVVAVKTFWKAQQPDIGYVYVGLSDAAVEGEFKTMDGKPVSEVYNKWEKGQPNDYHGYQDCVYLTDNKEINDWGCDYEYAYICKKSLESLYSAYPCNVQNTDDLFRNDYSYVEVEGDESFYKIHTTPRNWSEAKRVCALEGATLWHPDNEEEANAVISFWSITHSHIAGVYVGMSELMVKGLFETVDGKSVSKVYNHWMEGQPDGQDGAQPCVYMYKNGQLDDWGCNYEYSFICKKRIQSIKWNHQCVIPDPGYILNEENGRCYKLHTTPLTWKDAHAVCSLEQSHLAVITNQQEANYLANLTESTLNPRFKENYQRGIYHVGFHNQFKEGWQTVFGTRANVDADVWWDSLRPEDDRDQCGSMFYTGRLINTDCDMKSFFICENDVAKICKELELLSHVSA